MSRMDETVSTEQWLRTELDFIRRDMAHTLNGRLKAELAACDDGAQELTLRFPLQDWQVNGLGTLHGGSCAALTDQAMGCVCHCQKESAEVAPTIEMQMSFHRPVLTRQDILIRVQVVSVTRHLIRMAGQIFMADAPEKICVSANATFYCR